MTKELHDRVDRTKKYHYLGATVFIGLRSADVLLQYSLLHRGWASGLIEHVGGQTVSPAALHAANGQLQPYYGVISLMALGSSLKQILTIFFVTENNFPPSSALIVALFNTVFNSLNTIFSVWALTSHVPNFGSLTDICRSPAVIVGVGLYLTGILTEMVSELQRAQFKKEPANKGKPYAGGLFALARHVNYGGYNIWRAAYAFTSASWPWGLAVFSFFFYDFAYRGVPVLDKYLKDRVSIRLTYFEL